MTTTVAPGLATGPRHDAYETFLARCHALEPVVTAVAYLCEQTALTGVIEAAEAQEPSIWVIPTDEEAVIASHTLAVVRSLTPGPMAAGELAASPTDTGSGGKYL